MGLNIPAPGDREIPWRTMDPGDWKGEFATTSWLEAAL